MVYNALMPKVLVFGTFDGLHPGHRFLLTEASKRGDLHVVIARDANVMRIKGLEAIQSEQVRLQALQEAFPTATVMLGDPQDFLAPLKKVQPDLILLGYDQRLPPGVTDADLGSSVERLPAFEPEKWKSSLLRDLE
jgi:cytidyltransferase-like protein